MTREAAREAAREAPAEAQVTDASPAADTEREAASGDYSGPIGAMTVPAEGATVPGATAQLSADSLPEGYSVAKGDQGGPWEQLVGDDGQPVKVKGGTVKVEHADPLNRFVPHPEGAPLAPAELLTRPEQ
jgi:hypothetical protein